MNQGIENLKNNLPELKKQFNKFMDDFKDVKILGEKGIVIEYGMNKAGFVVHKSGNIDLNIDLKAISEAMGNSISIENLGVLKLGINYNTKISNINEDIKINMPNVNEKNALYFKDMMEQMNSGINEEIDIQEKSVECK